MKKRIIQMLLIVMACVGPASATVGTAVKWTGAGSVVLGSYHLFKETKRVFDLVKLEDQAEQKASFGQKKSVEEAVTSSSKVFFGKMRNKFDINLVKQWGAVTAVGLTAFSAGHYFQTDGEETDPVKIAAEKARVAAEKKEKLEKKRENLFNKYDGKIKKTSKQKDFIKNGPTSSEKKAIKNIDNFEKLIDEKKDKLFSFSDFEIGSYEDTILEKVTEYNQKILDEKFKNSVKFNKNTNVFDNVLSHGNILITQEVEAEILQKELDRVASFEAFIATADKTTLFRFSEDLEFVNFDESKVSHHNKKVWDKIFKDERKEVAAVDSDNKRKINGKLVNKYREFNSIEAKISVDNKVETKRLPELGLSEFLKNTGNLRLEYDNWLQKEAKLAVDTFLGEWIDGKVLTDFEKSEIKHATLLKINNENSVAFLNSFDDSLGTISEVNGYLRNLKAGLLAAQGIIDDGEMPNYINLLSELFELETDIVDGYRTHTSSIKLDDMSYFVQKYLNNYSYASNKEKIFEALYHFFSNDIYKFYNKKSEKRPVHTMIQSYVNCLYNLSTGEQPAKELFFNWNFNHFALKNERKQVWVPLVGYVPRPSLIEEFEFEGGHPDSTAKGMINHGTVVFHTDNSVENIVMI